MGLRINTNVASLVAQRNLSATAKALGKSLERLSSGSRINRAGDDAAGLAISEGLTSQIRGLSVAIRNSNDALGFLNTAEGALQEVTNISQRLRELSIQAANGTLSSTDRGYLNNEAQSLLAEFSRIANEADFNGTKLLDGSFATTTLQVGVQQGQEISFSIGDGRSSSVGALASVSGAQNRITASNSTLVINSVAISASVSTSDTVSSDNNSFSAIAQAAAINAKSGTTGVKALALDTIVGLNDLDFSTFAGTLAAGDFQINNVDIVGTSITSVSSFLDAINAKSNSTGVIASLVAGSSDDIQLTAADGRNIQIELDAASSTASTEFFWALADTNNFSTGNAFATGGISIATDVTLTGAVKLTSADNISISGTSPSTALGFSTTSVSVDEDSAINDLDISTQAGAQEALSTVDAALEELAGLRADLGAVQNRLDSTVRNLQVTIENVSAARSQLKDADIASETAELTRAQILQQAGVSVLGQANSSAQVALALLQF